MMKTTAELHSTTISNINLTDIAFSKLKGQKKDYFIEYKYDLIKKYYGNKCLDIGAGNGDFSAFLNKQGHNVESIDVIDNSSSNTFYKIQLFNGKEIPFDSNSFDTSLLMFVLHHTDHQEELLKSCINVTRGHIIIAEDIIRNPFDLALGTLHLNTSPWSKSHNSFRSHEQWLTLFDTYRLELMETITIGRWAYPIYPITRKIYVLKVNK